MKVELEHIISAEDPNDCMVVRDWPAVPRKDEHVEMSCPDHPDGHTGTVRIVLWGDDGVPLVRYR
jgi:hypothetical protein